MNRDFKGIWIPREVWLDERLTALEKIILMEIDSLDVEEEGCYASNQYIAEFCQCKENKVSNSIKKLIELEYLEIIKFDGRRRFLRSRLIQKIRQTYSKDKADLFKRYANNIDNNIDNKKNIIINNNIKKEIKKSYGEYKRIKLTDKEYNKLLEDFGEEKLKQQIKLLDEYIETNNNKNKYTNFNLVIRKSFRENWFNNKKETNKQEVTYDML